MIKKVNAIPANLNPNSLLGLSFRSKNSRVCSLVEQCRFSAVQANEVNLNDAYIGLENRIAAGLTRQKDTWDNWD